MVKFIENALVISINDLQISDELRKLINSSATLKRDFGLAIITRLEEQGDYDINTGWLMAEEPDFIDVDTRIRLYIKRDRHTFDYTIDGDTAQFEEDLPIS